MLKQSRVLTAFQQDRNPLIQLNQDNIENTEKRLTMPPTLPTENATIQQKNIPNCKKTHRLEEYAERQVNKICTDPHVSHHTNRESHVFDFFYVI